MNRRTFFKAIGAVAAACGLPVKAATPVVATTVPDAVVAPTYPWRWWVGYDEEIYREDFATREEAIAYAKRCDFAYVAECQQQDFSLEIEADDVLDRLADWQYDLIGEGDFIDTTKEQRADLSDRLTRVMYEWARDHNICLTAWSFGGLRNRERVDAPEPAIRGGDAP